MVRLPRAYPHHESLMKESKNMIQEEMDRERAEWVRNRIASIIAMKAPKRNPARLAVRYALMNWH